MLESAYRAAGFHDKTVLANVPEADRIRAWTEIEEALSQFETADDFVGPCELLVGAARK